MVGFIATFVIGALVGAGFYQWWRAKTDYERSVPPRWFRHKQTRAYYREMSSAAPPESPMDRHRILETWVRLFDRNEHRVEIWREADVARDLEPSEQPEPGAALAGGQNSN